jgi:hypothetical protein
MSVTLATVYQVAPDLSELDAMQVLLLVNLSEQEGYPITHALIERIIDRVIYSGITGNQPRQRSKSNQASLFHNLNS